MTKRQYDFVKLIEESVQTPRRIRDEILVWLYFSQLSDFTDLIGINYICDNRIGVTLKDNCVVVDIKDILEYLEIDEDVLEVGDE